MVTMERNEDANASNAEIPEQRHRRRSSSHRHIHGRRGRVQVWLMMLLLLGLWGWRGYLTVNGIVHPLALGWQGIGIGALVIDGSLTLLGIFCLLLLYRGNVQMRFLVGAVSAAAAFVYAILFAWNWMAEGAPFWLFYDAAAVLVYAFAARTCLFSRSAARFLASQEK